MVFYNSHNDPYQEFGLVEEKREARTLVCVGRITKSKGQDVLIRAVARLAGAFKDITVQFIGDGPDRERCQGLAQSLGLSRNCQFLGSLPRSEVFRFMARARVCVVPSLSEAFGQVAIEALSVGTPVVASAVGGLTEIVRENGNGFQVPAGDGVALASRIELLLSEHDTYERLGVEGRRDFLKRFEMGSSVREQADWLETLVF